MEGVGIIVLNYRMTERLKVDSWRRKYCTGGNMLYVRKYVYRWVDISYSLSYMYVYRWVDMYVYSQYWELP